VSLIKLIAFYFRDRKFFQEGKVFAVIFSETAGDAPTAYSSAISVGCLLGHRVHTQTPRFVVVRHKREFCFACPIFTYSGRATLKPDVRAEEHGILYSDGQSPSLLPYESDNLMPSIALRYGTGCGTPRYCESCPQRHPSSHTVQSEGQGRWAGPPTTFINFDWVLED
jgi:hypothetical protein